MLSLLDLPERLSARLPNTPCTEEMRAQVEAVARKEGVKPTVILRMAVALFLSTYDTFSTTESREG